jgi:hypothetical protein
LGLQCFFWVAALPGNIAGIADGIEAREIPDRMDSRNVAKTPYIRAFGESIVFASLRDLPPECTDPS